MEGRAPNEKLQSCLKASLKLKSSANILISCCNVSRHLAPSCSSANAVRYFKEL